MQNNPAPSPSRSARNASSEAAKDGFPVHEKSAMVTPTSSVMVPTYFQVVSDDPLADIVFERAITREIEVVAVEDSKLAAASARSIQIGNILHKTAVLAGLGGVLCHTVKGDAATRVMLGLSVASVGAASLYGTMVQADPICKYQVDVHGAAAEEMPAGSLKPDTAYVIFVRRNDTARKVVHYTLALAAACLYGWRMPEQVARVGTSCLAESGALVEVANGAVQAVTNVLQSVPAVSNLLNA
eukprot:m.58466 g.58466  ORF g.58466 m.58466 type:complete len:242 (-) comp15653_c0_seq2:113-838(-)